MQSEFENGTDYEQQTGEDMPDYEMDNSWHREPPTPNGFRKKSKKNGCNFTKSKKKRK